MAARVRDVVWSESARDALDAAASLASFAERGRVVPELNDPAIREVFVDKYRLQYEVGEARVLIVAFLYGARDFAMWRQNQKKE